MEQMACNVTMEDTGSLINRRYLLHDRDSRYCSSFRQVIEARSVRTLALPPRSPNLNAYCFSSTSFCQAEKPRRVTRGAKRNPARTKPSLGLRKKVLDFLSERLACSNWPVER